MNKNFEFLSITTGNIDKFKKLRRIYANYKIQTLRNHGETPGSKKMFYNLFDGIISRASDSDSDFFVVMLSGKEIIGFALISTSSEDFFDIPYNYGSINDFYISPEYRRKGFGRTLNEYIESIYKNKGTRTVMLFPDPVNGIPFWQSMKYHDTGFHQGWGHYFVYCKHLIQNEHTSEIDNAISVFVKPVDEIGINPYNKPQIKEIYDVWKEYCKETNRKPHRNDIKNMAWNARRNKDISFKALYYQGKITGFIYKADNEINYYVLPGYKNIIRKEESE